MPADGGWISKGMPKNRPLYDLLTLDKSLPLVIVEGEKACVAAREIGLHATTWAGGSGAVDKTDWSTLAGFDVIVWPDADEPGRKAARQIAKTLHGVAARVRILPDDPDAADGDDAADVLDAMGQEKALEHFRDRLELAIDWTPPQPATSGFPQPGNGKPRVIFPLNYNDPSMIFEQVIPHLANAGVYYRDGSLCRIIQGDSVNIRGVSKLSVSGPMIDTHDADSILPVLCKAIDFQAEYWRGDVLDIKPITPRIEFIKWFLRLRKWQGTPFLAGVTSGPFLRHDGTVCTTPGYDAASGWYLDYDGEPIEVPDHPTKDQAKNACRELLALVDDFEWKSEAQSCGFLAHLMTLAARPGIEGPVPAFVFTASTLGAGKTLLANVANIITLGHAASIYSPPQARHESDSAEEWKKMLFAHAATGNPSLVVDNYPSGKPVGNAAIDGVISSTKMIGRPLQTSKVRESAWVAVMVFTGNNLSCTADFAPRSMWAVLEPTWENPRERTGFKIPDLDGYARKHRAELLGYALTILRWHAAEGKPKAGGKNAGTFEEWASTVRDPIMHLTGHDVTQNSRDAVITDQEADELGTLLGGLHEYFEWRKASGKPQPAFTVAELHGDLNDLNNASSWSGLREVVDASLSYRAFCTSVGRLLPKYRGRVSGGMKLIVTTVNRKHYWRIDVVNPSPLSERDRG
jgi:putative DNA primase/helicase